MDSIYEKRPWLKNYPDGVPQDLEITSDTERSARIAVAVPRYGVGTLLVFHGVKKLTDQATREIVDSQCDAPGMRKLVLDLCRPV